MGTIPEEERGFMVLLEEVQGDVKLLIDYYLQLDQKIDRIAHESIERDTALDHKLDQGFATVVREIRALGQRFDAHERAHAS